MISFFARLPGLCSHLNYIRFRISKRERNSLNIEGQKKSDRERRILTMSRRADLSRKVDPFPFNVKFMCSCEAMERWCPLISGSMG